MSQIPPPSPEVLAFLQQIAAAARHDYDDHDDLEAALAWLDQVRQATESHTAKQDERHEMGAPGPPYIKM
jgi:hypothetical protein